VVRWIDGEHPAVAGPGSGSRARLARDLAGVVRALRQLEVPPEARHDAALRSYRAASLTGIDSDDLFAENLLVRRGRLTAVLDFGGSCSR
jgi:hypothetical protein